MTRELWSDLDELSYQIGFDRPIFVDDLLPDPTVVKKETDPKRPIPPKPVERPQIVPPIRQAPVERKHITRTGK